MSEIISFLKSFEGLIGVIIGSLIGIIGTMIQMHHSKHMLVIERRVECYLKVIDAYVNVINLKYNVEQITKLSDIFSTITPSMYLFASDKIKSQWKEVTDFLIAFKTMEKDTAEKVELYKEAAEKCNIMIQQMRKELKCEK